MSIAPNKVVSVFYTLTDDQGNVIDSNKGQEQPLTYIHGAGMMIPGFEKSLAGVEAGQNIAFSVTPEEGYGLRSDENVFVISRSQHFKDSDDIQAGGMIAAEENGHQRHFVILSVEGDDITLDANHFLAGKTLNFDVDVVDVRDATEQELAHGHVHAGGHDH
ncbi:peptidylprolyl isomerase [Wohlfahrtiimonas chitiniclastica]|uniref:Peptidyl-prolyl cis-trans isomerase n=2 Tax=Wohlfahrtiimonas chitiniclastica TaxID=400946 RepID=L8XZ84_9GAMM|nr:MULTISPECIES: peptidylprolyl isomerase [Wohlfahrtiimonas]ELV07611.1 FKBP-type peptidyl-prolyl cis-trans isomerase slyD [Wohlfahrtiimonas chitiniclastica SH04]KZS23595.1 FKBP-type peptidyl-prolyl cis-trans isomerase [Wohlfahrtiimonas chitiniclastica]KZX36359.1 peptidylprolyl isomerase [Wohlfahrtiimonas chitiniclastica]MBS7814868.1 peptidylprolyl isomerase [Wohlfahrtiimonas chitiniclastica]MBS7816997.1 peptidylprolyl isomerase [Wohlfahrtiimonas chitiniclastica]